MRILSRYFAARFLTLFAAILFASTLTVSVVELLLNFDEVIAPRDGAAGVLAGLLLRIPAYYLGHLIPLSVFAASFFSLGLATRWLETTALAAGGISPRRAALPIVCAAVGLAALSHLLDETLTRRSTRAWDQPSSTREDELTFRQGAFWYHRGPTIYNIQGADRETRTLRGIRLYQRDALGRPQLNIEADRVTVEADGIWHFEDATVRRFQPGDAQAAPEVGIGIDLRLAISDHSDAILLDADAGNLPLPRLVEYIAANRERAYPGSEASLLRLRRLLHERLAAPFTVVLFSLLAVPLALRAGNERGLGPASLQAVATLAGFFLVQGLAASLAGSGLLPVAAAPWGVLAIFLLWSGVGLVRVAR